MPSLRLPRFCAASLLLAATRLSAAVVQQEFIYEQAPFPQCHASTIVETPRGLVSAWFGGTRERNPDVGIWVARHEGGAWTAPVEVANGVQYRKPDGTLHRYPTWNPVLFQPRGGPLLLFFKAGPNAREWWGMMTSSTDAGRTWAEPRRLPDGIFGPIKNKPVQLANGDVLCPVSYETPESPSRWTVHFERTRDFGRTWERTEALHDGIGVSAIQPSILFLGGDRLLALGRTRQDRLFQIESADGGRTGGPISLGQLPNPNSGTDALTLRDGRHLVVYNHSQREAGKGGKRSPLNLAVSRDGRAWQAALVLEDAAGEYSYPAMIQTADGRVHLTYTWRRERIKHVVVDPAKLVARDFVGGEWPK